MFEIFRNLSDKFRGEGDSAIAIPVLDGALKPNRLLEDAEVFATLDAPEDLATDGKSLFAADGNQIVRFDRRNPVELRRFESTVTAITCLPGGGLAVAIDGRLVKVIGGPFDGREWSTVGGRALLSANAISPGKAGTILVTEGSANQPYERWCHDLMERGRTGRLLQLDARSGTGKELKKGLQYAFGCCAAEGAVWYSETWKHRVMTTGVSDHGETVVDWLPGYPCRISPAGDGGFWLCAMAGRTQLVEFVLRENGYRKRMMKEVDPRYWIAPALSSTDDFLEPLQAAHVKMRGVLKPYAPPRSYGLVIRLDSKGIPVSSFQSRLDGKNHGVVAAVELQGMLFALAKGNRRILKLPLRTV